jgi:hypothetical protein
MDLECIRRKEKGMARSRIEWPTNPRYREYLNSPAWEEKRKAVKARCNGTCERCHKYLVDEVHHLTYAHIFNEPLEDLQGLCKPCHKFLEELSGIDPLVKSIHIKVSWKLIEYWDSKARRFRRVSLDKLRPASQRGQLGKYNVPIDVFLDEQGTPVFDPSRWEPYRVAMRIGRHWHHFGEGGRAIPRDRQTVKQDVVRQEQRKADEKRRLAESPAHFTSYQLNMPKTPKEVMALFRKYPRIVDAGKDCTILSVRETFRLGIVLDLHHDSPDGDWIRYKIYEAERKLAQGEILLDHDRGTWVVTEQQPLPNWVLGNFGITT